MSMYGDSRNYMNSLYEEINDFFERGGTIGEFFEVLSDSFKYHNFNKED